MIRFKSQFVLRNELRIQTPNPFTYAYLISPNCVFLFPATYIARNKTGLVISSIDYYSASLVGLSALPLMLQKQSSIFPCART